MSFASGIKSLAPVGCNSAAYCTVTHAGIDGCVRVGAIRRKALLRPTAQQDGMTR